MTTLSYISVTTDFLSFFTPNRFSNECVPLRPVKWESTVPVKICVVNINISGAFTSKIKIIYVNVYVYVHIYIYICVVY